MAGRELLIGIASLVVLIAGKANDSETGVQLGVEPPSEAVATRGRGFALACGPPAPGTAISWLKDGRPIVDDSRVSAVANGSLVFAKVLHKKKGPSDAGEYRCLAKNKNGTLLSRPSRLIIPVLSHEFRTSPAPGDVREGDVARLTCYVESTPPATITWLKDSKPLPQIKRYTPFDSGILYITNVKQEDAGSYSCEAKNSYVKKTPQSKDGLLKVIEGGPPKPIRFLTDSPPSVMTAKAGKPVALICAVSGLPKPSLTWVHVKQDGNKTLPTTNNGLNIYRFAKIQVQNSGTYVCTATQTAKEKPYIIYKKVTITVETPPQIIEKPKSEVYPAAKTVRIDCVVKGHPQPEIVWYKDGAELYINGRIKKNPTQLVIGAAVTQDTGIYQCFVGDLWAAARIVVHTHPNQPQPPANLTCNPLSPTQIRLSWTPMPGTVQAFSVHYFPTEGGEENKEVTQNNSYTVQKLQPYTNYTFYIRSYGKSASEQSLRVICSTGETFPTGGPQVNVTITGSHCLLVTWIPPPTAKARGAITSYKVQWKRVTQSSVNFELLPGHINQYRIAGLKGGEKYMIRVLAATSLGWPEFPDAQAWTNVTLPLVYLADLPSPSITTSSINLTSLRIDWSFEYPHEIDGYLLSYGKVIGGSGGNITIPVNTTSYIISGLDSGSWYDIGVKVFYGKLLSEDCFMTVLVGGDGSLPPPMLMEAAPLSPSAIRVSWRPPPHESVTQYTLELESGGKILRTLITNRTEVEVYELNGDTVYEARVKAHGYHNKTSSYSFKLECRTPPYVIDVIIDVKCHPINSSAVLVTWSPLPVPAIHSYNIFYSRDLGAPINLWHSKTVQANETSLLLTGLRSNTKYVLAMNGVGMSGLGPLSPNQYFFLSSAPNGKLPPDSHQPHAKKSSDQLLGILVGCGISAVFIAVCCGTLLYRRRCLKTSDQPSQHEMTALTHLHSTKVGVHNGPVNGLKLFPNGRVVNGHALRITENPQAAGSSRDGREEVSLLNETDITVLDSTRESTG